MILFFISFLLVFATSYLLTSIISPKKNILGLIYLFIIAFAQIVLTFELLSLFSAIKIHWVLLMNILFFFVANYLWRKTSRQLWSLDCSDFKNRFKNSLRLDKSLIWLYIGFCVLLLSSLFLCIITPITNTDAQSYHVARSLFWVLQGNLSHFDTPDIRNLCLPINSEILYSWILLFIKKDVFLGFFSFVGYILSIISIFNILGLLGYCYRKRLWTIFILSSFSSVIVQPSGTETDLIIAGLVCSSIFLFWYGAKNNEKIPIFMASLAYALAIGTKTPALMMIPGVGLFMIGLSFYYKKSKPIKLFLSWGVLCFIIFASYNYIQNYIHFGNFFGNENFLIVSKNYYGLRGLFSNFIKYIFMFVDFTGFRWGDYVGPTVEASRNAVLNFCHLGNIPDGLYTIKYSVNRTLVEPMMGAGILGFLVFLPTLIYSLIKPVFDKRTKTKLLFAYALLFVINILSISYFIAYMSFSVRFVMSFMVLSSPILVYSYLSKRNPLKYIIILFSLFYLICVSTHLWGRPTVYISRMLLNGKSITYIREISACKDYEANPVYRDSACVLEKRIETKFSKKNKILIFLGSSDYIFLLKSLVFKGYNVDIKNLEDSQKIDFNKYNLIIIPNKGQSSTYIKDYENRKKYYTIRNNKLVILKRALVPCYYVKNSTIQNGYQMAPYRVFCFVTEKFITNKNLRKIDTVGVISSKILSRENIFTIYANENNPPIYLNN